MKIRKPPPRSSSRTARTRASGPASSSGCYSAAGITCRETKRGLEFFKKGCNIHLGVSCAAAAQMLEAGHGTPRDLDAARSMHGRACFLGVETSCAAQKRLSEFEERENELSRNPGDTGLTAEEITRVMERRRGSVAYCVELALERDPELTSLALNLNVKLALDDRGRVLESKITGTIDEPLAWCVGEAVRDFQFPAPRVGQLATAEHVYAFAATGNPEARDISKGRIEKPADVAPGNRPIIKRR